MANFARRSIAKIRQINHEYAAPRIHMSRRVRLSLVLLRVYLIVMIGLTLYKFVASVR